MINENELKQIKEKICEIEENSADGVTFTGVNVKPIKENHILVKSPQVYGVNIEVKILI